MEKSYGENKVYFIQSDVAKHERLIGLFDQKFRFESIGNEKGKLFRFYNILRLFILQRPSRKRRY